MNGNFADFLHDIKKDSESSILYYEKALAIDGGNCTIIYNYCSRIQKNPIKNRFEELLRIGMENNHALCFSLYGKVKYFIIV